MKQGSKTVQQDFHFDGYEGSTKRRTTVRVNPDKAGLVGIQIGQYEFAFPAEAAALVGRALVESAQGLTKKGVR